MNLFRKKKTKSSDFFFEYNINMIMSVRNPTDNDSHYKARSLWFNKREKPNTVWQLFDKKWKYMGTYQPREEEC